MRKSWILACLFMIMVGGACTQKQKPSIEIAYDGWKSYTTADYSIQFPGSWELDDSGRLGMTFQFLSPQRSPEDAFRENVNLVIQDLKGQSIKTLDQYTQYSLTQIKTMMKDSEILSEKRMNRNRQEYHRVLFKAEQEAMLFTFEQYYLIQGKKAYVLTLTCETDSFETYSAIGERFLNSFVLNR